MPRIRGALTRRDRANRPTDAQRAGAGRLLLAVSMSAALLAASGPPAQAQFLFNWWGERTYSREYQIVELLTPRDVEREIRRNGYRLLGPPRRNGNVYVVDAVDRRGTPYRLIVDGVYGEIVQRFANEGPPRPPGDIGPGFSGPRFSHGAPFDARPQPRFEERQPRGGERDFGERPRHLAPGPAPSGLAPERREAAPEPAQRPGDPAIARRPLPPPAPDRTRPEREPERDSAPDNATAAPASPKQPESRPEPKTAARPAPDERVDRPARQKADEKPAATAPSEPNRERPRQTRARPTEPPPAAARPDTEKPERDAAPLVAPAEPPAAVDVPQQRQSAGQRRAPRVVYPGPGANPSSGPPPTQTAPDTEKPTQALPPAAPLE